MEWIFRSIASDYGPIAFGVVSVVVLWRVIVAPELQRAQVDRKLTMESIDALASIGKLLDGVSRTLGGVVSRLESLERDKLKRRSSGE